MRIVGIDFGMKRIGISISDPTQNYALPLGSVLKLNTDEKTIDHLLSLLSEYQVETFVVGLPIHLSGHESPMSIEAKKFGEALQKKTNKGVEFIDERLTSKFAENILRETNMNRKKQSTKIDSLSATLILQTYLDLISLRK